MTSFPVPAGPAATDPFRTLYDKADWILRRPEDPSYPLPGSDPDIDEAELPTVVAGPPSDSPHDLVDRIVRQLEREQAEARSNDALYDGGAGDETNGGAGTDPASPYDNPNPSLLGAMPVGPVPTSLFNPLARAREYPQWRNVLERTGIATHRPLPLTAQERAELWRRYGEPDYWPIVPRSALSPDQLTPALRADLGFDPNGPRERWVRARHLLNSPDVLKAFQEALDASQYLASAGVLPRG